LGQKVQVDGREEHAEVKYSQVHSNTELSLKTLPRHNQKTELVSSSLRSDSNPDGFLNSASEVLILHRPKDMDPKEAPFTLLLEYSHEDVDYSDPDWE
jgi:hypothetical protein